MPKPSAGVDADLYRKLCEIEQGFRQAEAAIQSFRAHPLFLRSEIKRFAALWEETYSATASYLLGVLEQIETERAGSLARRRLQEERRVENTILR
jgi:hypothetical protein